MDTDRDIIAKYLKNYFTTFLSDEGKTDFRDNAKIWLLSFLLGNRTSNVIEIGTLPLFLYVKLHLLRINYTYLGF